MNLLLFDDSDLLGDGTQIRLTGRRLAHLRTVHRAQIGDSLRVGKVNGLLGTGKVEALDSEQATLSISLQWEPPIGLPTHLILALPRPKVLLRVLRTAATLGFKHIQIINAWRVDKSYWDSRRLEQSALQIAFWEGLEMARDTVLPTLRFHRFFRDFQSGWREQAETQHGDRWLCHPVAEQTLPKTLSLPAAIALGPEGGFIDREVQSFRDMGFQIASFGERILPVETAFTFVASRFC